MSVKLSQIEPKPEAERSALCYEDFPQVGKHTSRQQGAEWMQIDDVAIRDEANLPIDRSL